MPTTTTIEKARMDMAAAASSSSKRRKPSPSSPTFATIKSSPDFEMPSSTFLIRASAAADDDDDDFDNMLIPNRPSSTKKRRSSFPSTATQGSSSANRGARLFSSAKLKRKGTMAQHQLSNAIATPAASPALPQTHHHSTLSHTSIGVLGNDIIGRREDPTATASQSRGKRIESSDAPLEEQQLDDAKVPGSSSRLRLKAGKRSLPSRDQNEKTSATTTTTGLDVAAFLASLPLSLHHLHSTFISLGCTSAADLVALSSNSVIGVRCRDAMLDTLSAAVEGGLSPWERIVLVAGLESLAEFIEYED